MPEIGRYSSFLIIGMLKQMKGNLFGKPSRWRLASAAEALLYP